MLNNIVRKYYFENGYVLQVSEQGEGQNKEVSIILLDNRGRFVVTHFPSGRADILLCLLDKHDKIVPFKEIYKSYTNQHYDSTCRDLVTKEVSALRTNAKDISIYIKCIRKKGYKIFTKKVETLSISQLQNEHSNELTVIADNSSAYEAEIKDNSQWVSGLLGNYYGFYLDREGSGKLFGVYMHIENNGTEQHPEMSVHAIFGISSNDILFGEDIASVFKEPNREYLTAFAKVRNKLQLEAGCYLGSGTVSYSDGIAEIVFKATTDEKWRIFVDISGYEVDSRPRKCETDLYRGGCALALAFCGRFGNNCFRFAFVRCSLYTPLITLESERIRDILAIPAAYEENKWKPISLSRTKDKDWYNWFVDAYIMHSSLNGQQ